MHTRQPVEIEILTGTRLFTVDPSELEVGDEVDVPVQFNVWMPPKILPIDPLVYTTFHRVIILSKNR